MSAPCKVCSCLVTCKNWNSQQVIQKVEEKREGGCKNINNKGGGLSRTTSFIMIWKHRRNTSIHIFYEFHNIRDRAVKDIAKCIYCMDADALISLQTCHKRRAETVLGGQDIFCYALFFHGFPQLVVDNHNFCPEAKIISSKLHLTVLYSPVTGQLLYF